MEGEGLKKLEETQIGRLEAPNILRGGAAAALASYSHCAAGDPRVT